MRWEPAVSTQALPHPQPTNLRIATSNKVIRALRPYLHNAEVWDPFCGTATFALTAYYADAKFYIGWDLEAWMPRKEVIKRLHAVPQDGGGIWWLMYPPDREDVFGRLEYWRDALEFARELLYDEDRRPDVVLFDPPDPHDILGGRIHLPRKKIEEHLDARNLMGRKTETVLYVRKLINFFLEHTGAHVIVYAYHKHWARGCHFDWARQLKELGYSVIEIENPFVLVEGETDAV